MVVVSVSLGFNSPLYCLWWRGKILRYQVAPPLPASPDALCPLKMHGQFTNVDGSSLFPFLSFFFFFPFFLLFPPFFLFFFNPSQQHVPGNSLLPFTVKCSPGSINYLTDAMMDL